MSDPNMNCLSRTPTRVNGIQKTPSSRSLTARFSRNILVTDRIRLLAPSVMITSALPIMANRNIRLYGNMSVSICSRLITTSIISVLLDSISMEISSKLFEKFIESFDKLDISVTTVRFSSTSMAMFKPRHN